MTTDQQFTLEEIYTQLATWLVEEEGMTISEALDAVYNSDTYNYLQDPTTGLMMQSDAYIYDTLRTELLKGKTK